MIRVPKVQLAATLLLIFFSSLRQYPFLSTFYLLIICVGFTIIFDLLFTFLKRKTLFLPLAGIVSGLIITLLVDPNASWYQIAAICALAMASKNFIRVEDRHIFNPAAVGLFLGGVIFNLGVSWWGVSFQVIQPHFWSITVFLILLLPSYVSFYRMRRFGAICSFLIFYNLLSGFRILWDPTTIFFALVMLPEPMTSPFNLKRQILYGATVAVAVFVLSFVPIALPDVLIPALLLGNILFFNQR